MVAGNERRVIVVGGGLAGLAAAVRVAEAGVPVDLFSMIPVKRSHSVCAQGGINACNEVARQQGYSEYQHFDETLYGGDFLADQNPVLEMANWAPRIIDLLDRMGVPFNRTNEGGATSACSAARSSSGPTSRARRRGSSSSTPSTSRPGATRRGQGQQVRVLGVPLARHRGRGRRQAVRGHRRPGHADDADPGLPGDAVVMATGGNGLIFGQSTNSVICTGGAASRCYQAGAWYGNGEMIQVHPTAIPGADKCRLMSESARGEGGRVWVPRKPGDERAPTDIPEGERLYFLEEKYPAYGNLVPRDIATREIFDICVNQHMGIGAGTWSTST
jgi:succinate dehydrogenase / fumarate reductase flavoprotein subunit